MKRLGFGLLALLLAFSPIWASDAGELEFLDGLEAELTRLETTLQSWTELSKEQTQLSEKLKQDSLTLNAQLSALETRLDESQTQLTELKGSLVKLQTRWQDLEPSLQRSEEDLLKLKRTNGWLMVGIGFSLSIGLGALVYGILK